MAGRELEVVVGEVQLLITVMRLNRKWKSNPSELGDSPGVNDTTLKLVRNLVEMRQALSPSTLDCVQVKVEAFDKIEN